MKEKGMEKFMQKLTKKIISKGRCWWLANVFMCIFEILGRFRSVPFLSWIGWMCVPCVVYYNNLRQRLLVFSPGRLDEELAGVCYHWKVVYSCILSCGELRRDVTLLLDIRKWFLSLFFVSWN